MDSQFVCGILVFKFNSCMVSCILFVSKKQCQLYLFFYRIMPINNFTKKPINKSLKKIKIIRPSKNEFSQAGML